MMGYREREDIKHAAWLVLQDDSACPQEKAKNALLLIEAHYWRAAEAIDKSDAPFRRAVLGAFNTGRRLEIGAYARHWMWANGHLMTGRVRRIITMEFGYEPTKHAMLPKGRSMYGER